MSDIRPVVEHSRSQGSRKSERPCFSRFLARLPLRAALATTVTLAILVLILMHFVIVPWERADLERRFVFRDIGEALARGARKPSKILLPRQSRYGVDGTLRGAMPDFHDYLRYIARTTPKSAPQSLVPIQRLISAPKTLSGRVGNAMFAYAALIGVGRWTDRTPSLPPGHYFRETFRLSETVALIGETSRGAEGRVVKFEERRACTFDERATRLVEQEGVGRRREVGGGEEAGMMELVGYFQSWQYFEHVKDEVREQFRFRTDVAAAAAAYLDAAVTARFGSKVRRSDVTLIGLHIRRGDMASALSLSLGYTTATRDYVSRAIGFYRSRLRRRERAGRLLFVLATDDPDWCRENIAEERWIVRRGEDLGGVWIEGGGKGGKTGVGGGNGDEISEDKNVADSLRRSVAVRGTYGVRHKNVDEHTVDVTSNLGEKLNGTRDRLQAYEVNEKIQISVVEGANKTVGSALLSQFPEEHNNAEKQLTPFNNKTEKSESFRTGSTGMGWEGVGGADDLSEIDLNFLEKIKPMVKEPEKHVEVKRYGPKMRAVDKEVQKDGVYRASSPRNIGTRAAVADLAVLAACDHTIVTVGSFGWWGAWLAGGTVVYYRDFPRNGSHIAELFERRDYFPPHWIPM